MPNTATLELQPLGDTATTTPFDLQPLDQEPLDLQPLEEQQSGAVATGFHRVMNDVREFGASAGRYIFQGLEGISKDQAQLLANPPRELTEPQAEETLLPPGQQQQIREDRTAAAKAAAPKAEETAAYWKKRADESDAQSGVDPQLAQTWDARISRAGGPATVMGAESLIPFAGLPIMAMNGALASEAEARNAGKSQDEAEKIAVRSLIALGIFGGAAKTAALGVAKLLPEGSTTLTKFVAQLLGQDAANETSTRAIDAWNAASEAKPGEKLSAATKALTNTTLEASTLNAIYAGIGAAHEAGGGRTVPIRPDARLDLQPIEESALESAEQSSFQTPGEADTIPRQPEAGGLEAIGGTTAEPQPASQPLFRQDASIPFMTKIRIEDQLVRAGYNDAAIAQLTTPEMNTIVDELRAKEPSAPIEERPAATEVTESARPREQVALSDEEKARSEHESEQLDEFSKFLTDVGGIDLIDAVKLEGGLPAKGRGDVFEGELDNVRQAWKGRGIASDLFRTSSRGVDDLTSKLQARGFAIETPANLFDLLDHRIRTGKPIYALPEQGQAAYGGEVFAHGSTGVRGRFRAGQVTTRNLRPGDVLRETNLAGTREITKTIDRIDRPDRIGNVIHFTDGSAVHTSPNRRWNTLGRTNQIRQPETRTFASGAAAPRAASIPGLPSQATRRTPLPLPAPRLSIKSPVATAVMPVRSWWQQRTLGLRKLVAPQTIDAPARMVANIIRDYNGQLANKIVQADHALAAARKDFDRTPVPRSWKYDPAQPLPRNYAFIDNSERGGANLSAEDRQLKSQVDQMFSEAIDEVHRVKPEAMKSLIQDYFPHIWEDPEQAKRVFAQIVSKRPLEGTKGFLKQRVLEYTVDGLKAGLRPVSDNPIDMALTKLHEIHRFVAAQDMLTEAKAIGARKFVYIFEKPPEGWTKVEDATSTVHGPPFVTIPEAFDAQMRTKTVELLNKLGISHERLARLGGKRWGTYETGGAGVTTRFAGPLSVYWHELGHALQERYKWLDEIAPLRPVGKNHARLVVERQRDNFGGKSVIEDQLRKLADLRMTHGQSKSFEKYIRSKDEKAAVMLEAYIHAPDRMKQVAPNIYGRVQKFIANHPELKEIEDIRPNLALGSQHQRVDVGGMVTLGNYYMPEGAAQVFTNYLSPGLQRFGIIRNIRKSTNILSGFQLGFSAFHAGFTSLDTIANHLAVAARYALTGDLPKAAARIATAPVAPVLNYYTGKAIQTAMMTPEWGGKLKVLGMNVQLTPKATAFADQMAHLAVQAGLRATVDPFWRTQITRNMMRAWHEGGVKGFSGTILRAPFALSEQMMRPILEALVPRQKLGVFATMAYGHFQRLGPNADIHELRNAMARVADATEDRMGEMTYDNLFYHRNVKDAALLGFRAYGWTFGKYRATTGAGYDLLTIKDRVNRGEPWVTDRMTYPIGLVLTVAGIGSLMNYFMTGQLPQDWKDALMPRTGKLDAHGNPQRLSLPTYMKDLMSDWHDFPNPKKMMLSFYHKLNPEIAIAVDILNNADFYGTKIRNEDDPYWRQAADVFQHVLKSGTPFSITGAQKLSESDPSLMQQVLPFFGFVPAKQELSMTAAQLRASELMQDQLPRGARTKDQAEQSKMTAELMRDMRAQNPKWTGELNEALASGKVRPDQLGKLFSSMPLSPLQYQVKKLSAGDAMKIWDLAKPTERDQLRPILLEKLAQSKTLNTEDRVRYLRLVTQPSKQAAAAKPQVPQPARLDFSFKNGQ